MVNVDMIKLGSVQRTRPTVVLDIYVVEVRKVVKALETGEVAELSELTFQRMQYSED